MEKQSSMAPKTTNLALLFADISGSTRLYEILGDVATRTKIADYLDTLKVVVARHNGIVIKTIGDEIMCTFDTAEDAANAACEMHEILDDDVTEQTAAGPISLTIRVGMHYGPAILEASDVFGDVVNVAARMASMAKGGQIITTQNAVDAMSPIMRASTRFIDRAPVKGKKETIDIFEVLWQQEDVTRMSTGIITLPSPDPVRMRLTYKSDSVTLDSDVTQVVMGRSEAADLTVNESLASRHHVRIEHRRGKFFIIDQSTNGTYVHHENEEAFLRREEMPISGDGMISLGRSFSDNPQEVVHFKSEF